MKHKDKIIAAVVLLAALVMGGILLNDGTYKLAGHLLFWPSFACLGIMAMLSIKQRGHETPKTKKEGRS